MRKFMSKTKGKQLAYVLVIAWMGLIFFMSHQPANVSSNQSGTIIEILTKVGFDINSGNLGIVTTLVRKGAHLTEYLILSLLYYNLLRYYFDNKKARIFGVLFVFLYASTDEFHQIFIDGRAGRFTDVLIDTSGGIIGSIIVYLFNKFNIWL